MRKAKEQLAIRPSSDPELRVLKRPHAAICAELEFQICNGFSSFRGVALRTCAELMVFPGHGILAI